MRRRVCFLSGCTIVISAVFLFILTGPVKGGDFKESFANISEGALLTTLPKWTHTTTGPDNWVLSNFDTEGGGFEASAKGAYHRNMADTEAITLGKGSYSFKTKIRFTGANSYVSVHIDLMETGGVNGCGICFNSGAGGGSSDTTIAISESGKSWGDVKYNTPKAHWAPNVWYVVEFNDLNTKSGKLTGTVSIYDKGNPSTKLVDNAPIVAYGDPMGFDKIDIISISSFGADRPFQIGEIDLGKSNSESSN